MKSARFVKSVCNCSSKLFAIAFGVIGILCLSTTIAFATPANLKDSLYDPIKDQPILNDGDNILLAGCAGEISDGYGEVELLMPYGNYWASIQFSTGYNSGVSGAVEAFVKFPSGSIYNLGTVSASNGVSTPVEFFFCPYGTYTFMYEANVLDALDVAGFIYD